MAFFKKLWRSIQKRNPLAKKPETQKPRYQTEGWRYQDLAKTNLNPLSQALQLRKYPYPYQAAVAISNDTDGMTLPAFVDLHTFVNTTEETPYGPGVGLGMADSFWVWNQDRQFSLFHNAPTTEANIRSPETDIIAAFSQAGYLDSLHGFGGWWDPVPLNRQQIEFALEYMQGLGITPSIYINHGGSRPLHGGGGFHMAHNIGGPWGYYQHGDVPGKPSYCLDLLKQAGFRYFWLDVCSEREKFGEYLRYPNQQTLDKELYTYNFKRFYRRKNPDDFSQVIDATPTGPLGEEMFKRQLFHQILVPVMAGDNTPIYMYKRYRGVLPPRATSFATQVNEFTLGELCKREGAVIIYQHFGLSQALGTDQGHPSERINTTGFLDENTLWAFRTLAQYQNGGKVFVTTEKRLLDYLWVRDNLVYEVNASSENPVITITGIQCPVFGQQMVTPALLQGISFLIPREWNSPKIVIPGYTTPLAVERHIQPNDDRFDVLNIPFQRLEYPHEAVKHLTVQSR